MDQEYSTEYRREEDLQNDSSSSTVNLTSSLSNDSSKRRKRALIVTPDPFVPTLRQRLAPLSPFQWEHDQPDVTHWQKLLGALLLSSILASLSALDAHQQCLQHEANALLDLMDDDNFQKAYESAEETPSCRDIFARVILPTLISTIIVTGIGLSWLYGHKTNSPEAPHTTLNLTYRLCFIATTLFVIQTYNISSIMLWPKKHASDNPYSSLAAVDAKGRIADNANLFYTTWFSEAMAIIFLYQVFATYLRLRRSSRHNDSELLPSTSWQSSRLDSNARAKWYQSLYKLRIRTGFWFAALCSCAIIIASSQYIWAQVEAYPTTMTTEVCDDAQDPLLCKLTFFSWFSGLTSAILCASALILHGLSRRFSINEDHHHSLLENLWQHRLPLWTELALSGILSILLGAHAVVATSVVGPAARVGTLYYSAHLAFLLCLRVCLGCLEELFGIREKTEKEPHRTDGVDESERAECLRKYFFLSIFSFVCAASAYDAAVRQRQKFSETQVFMFYAPCWVSLSSSILFVIALSRGCYRFVASFYFGGIFSCLNFLVCFVNLILTMHSEDSWAVDGVGEILNGNLYYFCWASIVTAGLQMMSYVTKFLGIDEKDFMTVLWSGVCKLSFVILGAAVHIWTSISDNCDFDEITSGAVTFCSRTVLANAVALTGLIVSGLVVAGRVLLHVCPRLQCSRVQAHIEMLVSVFLLFVFGAAIAMVTSIGGPGQSVGDLYYSCTGAFIVTLVIVVSSYEHIQLEDHGLTSQDVTLRMQSQNSILV